MIWLIGSTENDQSIAFAHMASGKELASVEDDAPWWPIRDEAEWEAAKESAEGSVPRWPLILLIVLGALGAIAGLAWLANHFLVIGRGKRYEIQRRLVLQRANSATPSRTRNHHQQQPLTAVAAAATTTNTATTVDRNISAFELGTRNWT